MLRQIKLTAVRNPWSHQFYCAFPKEPGPVSKLANRLIDEHCKENTLLSNQTISVSREHQYILGTLLSFGCFQKQITAEKETRASLCMLYAGVNLLPPIKNWLNHPLHNPQLKSRANIVVGMTRSPLSFSDEESASLLTRHMKLLYIPFFTLFKWLVSLTEVRPQITIVGPLLSLYQISTSLKMDEKKLQFTTQYSAFPHFNMYIKWHFRMFRPNLCRLSNSYIFMLSVCKLIEN